MNNNTQKSRKFFIDEKPAPPSKNRLMTILWKKLILLFPGLLLVFVIQAQPLKTFEVKMNIEAISYLSIEAKRVYNTSEATANKQLLDFVLLNSKGVIEWYNLSGKDEKTPRSVQGNATKIAPISFDREQFDQCRTVEDLKRMTGYKTSSSFSHFAVLKNSDKYIQQCFIYEKEDGKRGLVFVTVIDGSSFKIEVKGE